MSAKGDRLPYLLRALKAPRIIERLQATAERARAEGWPYEPFLEALCEAEVFAREASRLSEFLCVRPGRLVVDVQPGNRSPKWILRAARGAVQVRCRRHLWSARMMAR
jgi:hypothetical protein